MTGTSTLPLNLIKMVVIRLLPLAFGLLFLPGCTSYSSAAIAELSDRSDQSAEFQSAGCQSARQNAWLHDDLKNVKLWATPSLLLIAGPVMVVPVLFANVGLNTADHLTANEIKTNCGGKALTDAQITQSIAVDTGLGVLTGTVLSGSVAPASTAFVSKP
jgi:hypothetical protein